MKGVTYGDLEENQHLGDKRGDKCDLDFESYDIEKQKTLYFVDLDEIKSIEYFTDICLTRSLIVTKL